ncbi:MAG: pyridoxal phosphate-dependent class II aminotransferase [Gammaproteobacteria bacterium]|nr:pyridoxal phosphate-dependent class II aminotransferase [Gammaproteobacteria bacterium]
MPDHGGNLDEAIRLHGGSRKTWIDLSTGINPRPYPLPAIPDHAWSALPTRNSIDKLETAAGRAYGTGGCTLAMSGVQSAIQLIPRLKPAGQARILGPTYNEHAAAFEAADWRVEHVSTLEGLAGADTAVVVNPNNPDGQRHEPDALVELSYRVGLLVVDESFCDVAPGLSVASRIGTETASLLVQRSFGKFYGLAGIRLGFVMSGSGTVDALRRLAGPWPVSGPAIAVAPTTLSDDAWRIQPIRRLERDASRLARLALRAGWRLVGGTPLFRTYEIDNMDEARKRLISHRVWPRVFPNRPKWLRLGIPCETEHWLRVDEALRQPGC